jgi:hypothetical protein
MITVNRQSGFSLLETLLGLTLTAMVAMLMVGSLELGARVWERGQGGNGPTGRHVLDNRVSDWIAQALPSGVYDTVDTDAAPFRGEQNAASWITAGENLGGPPGIYRMDMMLREVDGCDGGKQLAVNITRISPEAQLTPVAGAIPTARELSPCLASPAFAYYGVPDGMEAASWRAEWIQQGRLPLILQLRSGDENETATAIVFSQRLMRSRFQ